VTLETPRLSFVGKLDTGNSVGGSTVTIVTTAGSASSTTSTQLAEGDVVGIGNDSTITSYTVASASATDASFTISSTLQSGDTDTGDAVIATQSGSVTVKFTTATAIANGTFRILIPAHATAASDGIPDQDGFDFGTSAPTVTCPTDISSTYDFVTGTATASAFTLAGVNYHSYECRYSGNGAASTAFDGSSHGAITISNLINPSPASDHVQGNSDVYPIVVQHLDSSFAITDSTIIHIGNIESVRVTANVPQQITFAVTGLNSGTSACGASTSVTTTQTQVPFGTVSTATFYNASQAMAVSTNAANGFTVTAIANDQLGKDGGACAGDPPSSSSCIIDANVSGMSASTSQDWTSTSEYGFGYSIQDPSSTTTEAFSYNESGRTFSARQFPDAENSESAQTIFSSASPANNENIYLCYRVNVDPSTTAGDYSNTVTYRATASF
jgi:hypothetical protein